MNYSDWYGPPILFTDNEIEQMLKLANVSPRVDERVERWPVMVTLIVTFDTELSSNNRITHEARLLLQGAKKQER